MQWYHAGWAGRLSHVTDGDGDRLESYHYSAFGEVDYEGPTGQPLPDSRLGVYGLIGGQVHIAQLGLHRMGQRWQRPAWGRFTTPDPAGYFDGPNRYTFVGGQPLLFWDPAGLGRSVGVHPETLDRAGARRFVAQRPWSRT